MTLRTITGTIMRPDGTAWADGAIVFTLAAPLALTDATTLPAEVEAATDSAGAFELDLVVPDDGAAAYTVKLPDRSTHSLTITAGGPVSIGTLIASSSQAIAPSALQAHASTIASSAQLGHVKVDGLTIEIAEDGTISAAASGLADGDKGAIVVSNGGLTWTLRTLVAADMPVAVPLLGAQALVDAPAIAWDAAAGAFATLAIAGNRTLSNPTGLKAGAAYALKVTQDATGGRTLAYGSAYKWPAGVAPVLSTAAGAVDILTFISDGANLFGAITKAWS